MKSKSPDMLCGGGEGQLEVNFEISFLYGNS